LQLVHDQMMRIHSEQIELTLIPSMNVALGQKQTSRYVRVMSVIPLKADIHQRGLRVRLVPAADIRDSLVGVIDGGPAAIMRTMTGLLITPYRYCQTKAPRVSSQGFRLSVLPTSGLPTRTGLRVGTVSLARRQTLYQSELKTLAAPTLVVLHFPVHAFHA
jgi:hypothetical protein